MTHAHEIVWMSIPQLIEERDQSVAYTCCFTIASYWYPVVVLRRPIRRRRTVTMQSADSIPSVDSLSQAYNRSWREYDARSYCSKSYNNLHVDAGNIPAISIARRHTRPHRYSRDDRETHHRRQAYQQQQQERRRINLFPLAGGECDKLTCFRAELSPLTVTLFHYQ